MIVIVPTRGRPHNIVALQKVWDENTDPELATLVVAIDDDDPRGAEYKALGGNHILAEGKRLRMVGTLNSVAMQLVDDGCDAIGFIGDDHRVQTKGWAAQVLAALDDLGTGIVYGNDLIHGENLPTAVFMTSNIVRTLGYMAPPTFTHLYIDNVWLEWMRALGCGRYLPDVIVEHVHPLVGKAEEDDGYREVNSGAMYAHDKAAFEEYKDSGRLEQDIEKIRNL